MLKKISFIKILAAFICLACGQVALGQDKPALVIHQDDTPDETQNAAEPLAEKPVVETEKPVTPTPVEAKKIATPQQKPVKTAQVPQPHLKAQPQEKTTLVAKEEEPISDSKWQRFLEKAKALNAAPTPEDAGADAGEVIQTAVGVEPAAEIAQNVPKPRLRPNKLTKAKHATPTLKTKSAAALPASLPEKQDESAQEAVIAEEPVAIAPEKAPEPQAEEPKAEEVVAGETVPVAAPQPAAPAPVIIKQNKQPLSALMAAMPAFQEEETPAAQAENAPEIPEIKEDIAEKPREKVTVDADTEEKLSRTIDSNMEKTPLAAPPVPEPVTSQLKTVTPSNHVNPRAVIIQDSSEKSAVAEAGQPHATADKNILLSVAFDGNNVNISEVDKDRISKFVKGVLTSGKRLKVISYARGIDGAVNSARRLSLQRAIAVRAQMIQAGLEKSRINVQAAGNNPGDQEFVNSTNIYVLE